MEARLVGFCGLASQGREDFLALLTRLGLGVSDWVGSIQAEEEVEEEEEGEVVVKGLFIKKLKRKKKRRMRFCVFERMGVAFTKRRRWERGSLNKNPQDSQGE